MFQVQFLIRRGKAKLTAYPMENTLGRNLGQLLKYYADICTSTKLSSHKPPSEGSLKFQILNLEYELQCGP